MLLRLIVQTWLAEWTEITGHYSVSIISSQGRRSLFACAALILGEWRVVVAGGGRLRLWVCDCKWNRSINNAWLSAGGWFLHPDQYSTVLSLFEGVSVQSAILAFFCPFFPPPPLSHSSGSGNGFVPLNGCWICRVSSGSVHPDMLRLSVLQKWRLTLSFGLLLCTTSARGVLSLPVVTLLAPAWLHPLHLFLI